MIIKNSFFYFIIIYFFLIPNGVWAKKKNNKNEKSNIEKKIDPIESFTKKCKKYEGLFTLYQDTINGNLYLLIKSNQLNKEYIYFSTTVDAIVGVGFRGLYRRNNIISFEKYFDRIDLFMINDSYYYDPKSPLSKAARANVSQSLIVTEKIEAKDDQKGEYLIKADDIYLTENLDRIRYTSGSNKLALGFLNKEKTRYTKIKSFPLNTDVEVEYAFDNPTPNKSQNDVADERYVIIKIYHSFIEVPKSDFKPRPYDSRVGYNYVSKENLTTNRLTYYDYRDLICKWDLQKKDSIAKLSEPIKPIVFWISNTTPYEFRDVIRDAVLKWNKPFEQIGYKNAIQVFIQSDTATWQTEDIRYNVIQWVASPTATVGGIGPRLIDLRTGQIIASDVTLEYSALKNRIIESQLINSISSDNLSFVDCLPVNPSLGIIALTILGKEDSIKTKLMNQCLSYLVLHETGHALGLTHNFMGSFLHSFEELKNKKQGDLSSTVMDYFSDFSFLSNEKNQNSLFFQDQPGPYDYWAIEYGYSEDLNDNQKRIEKTNIKSKNPIYVVGDDFEAMNQLNRGIDPRVMLFDWTNDPIGYEIKKLQFTNGLINKLVENYLKKNANESFQNLITQYALLHQDKLFSAMIISRYIGGVYVTRNRVGANIQPFTPVSYQEQKRAMQALSDYFFSIKDQDIPVKLFQYLKKENQGLSTTAHEDFKIHDGILTLQSAPLSHLLSYKTLQRILDSEMYGNTYRLEEMLTDLTNSIFKNDINKDISTIRQNLQIYYVRRLLAIVNPSEDSNNNYSDVCQRALFQQLKEIQKMINNSSNSSVNNITKSHKEFILQKIKKGLSEK